MLCTSLFESETTGRNNSMEVNPFCSFLRFLHRIIPALVITTLLFAGMASAQTSKPFRVLVLHSYHQGFAWTDSIMTGIQTVLNQSDPDIELLVEYMDTKRHNPNTMSPCLAEAFKIKYRQNQPHVILLADNDALTFMTEHRDTIFPGVPVVFCGINSYSDSLIEGHSGFTGVAEETDINGTLNLILSLHPQTKQVAVISDVTSTGVINRERIHKIMPRFADTVKFIDLANLTSEELKKALHQLPADTVILHSSFFLDRAGRSRSLEESFAFVSENCNLPIYSLWELTVGIGALGGIVTSGRLQGENAAHMVLKILRGESVDSIPVLRRSPNTPMFDYNQMKRFGISLSKLPAGSTVINESVSFYWRHRGFIWTVTGIVIMLTATILALFINIQHRLRVEEALGMSEEKFRSLVETTSDWVWELDEKGFYTYVSPKVKDLLGYEPEEIIGSKPSNLMPKDKVRDFLGIMREVIRSKDSFTRLENTFLHFDGHLVIMETSGVPILDEQGKLKGYRGIDRDITDRKRTEEALKESEARYRAIVEDQTELICRFLPDGTITFVNDAFCRYFEEKLGEPMRESRSVPFIPMEHQGKIEEYFDSLGHEGPVSTYEHCITAPDGKTWWQQWTHRTIPGENGNVAECQSVGRDITERKQMEEALEKSAEKIKLFAYSVSHDLKSPAIGIHGLTGLLHRNYRDFLDEKGRKYCDQILKASEHVVELVEKINTYIATKETPLTIEKVNVNEVLRMVRDELSPRMSARHIRWIEPETTVEIHADRLSIMRVFRNFIDNAIKYSGDQLSEIRVGYEALEDFHIFSVSDDGVGIKREDQDKIFGLFQRNSTSKGVSGTGLGLAIVKEIAELHRGRVWVEPGAEKGTIFYISIARNPHPA